MPCHATPTNNRGNNRARSWLFRTFVKAKVKVHLIGLTLSLTVLSWMLDSTRKGREPRFTLSSFNQLIVQTRRAVFGENLLLSSCLLSLISCPLSNLAPPQRRISPTRCRRSRLCRCRIAPPLCPSAVVRVRRRGNHSLAPRRHCCRRWLVGRRIVCISSCLASRFSPCSATGSGCFLTFITLSLSSRNQSASYLRLLSSLYCILVSARCTSLDRAIQFPDQPLPYIYTWTSLTHHSL